MAVVVNIVVIGTPLLVMTDVDVTVEEVDMCVDEVWGVVEIKEVEVEVGEGAGEFDVGVTTGGVVGLWGAVVGGVVVGAVVGGAEDDDGELLEDEGVVVGEFDVGGPEDEPEDEIEGSDEDDDDNDDENDDENEEDEDDE